MKRPPLPTNPLTVLQRHLLPCPKRLHTNIYNTISFASRTMPPCWCTEPARFQILFTNWLAPLSAFTFRSASCSSHITSPSICWPDNSRAWGRQEAPAGPVAGSGKRPFYVRTYLFRSYSSLRTLRSFLPLSTLSVFFLCLSGIYFMITLQNTPLHASLAE